MSIEEIEKQEEKSTKLDRILVGSRNFLSQHFFIWVFRFIAKLRRDKSDFKDIELYLNKSETAEYNDDILEKNWQEEIKRASNEKRFEKIFLNREKNNS